MVVTMRVRCAGLAIALLAIPLIAATPADAVRTRVAGLKQLGSAYKAVNDAARAGSPASAAKQQAAQIVAAARAMYRWFPTGSGPRPGVKTAAKDEIWSNPRAFRATQDNFDRQALAFERAIASGNADLKAEARKLGAACKGCHDQFREQSD